jgi:hypothetical protein
MQQPGPREQAAPGEVHVVGLSGHGGRLICAGTDALEHAIAITFSVAAVSTAPAILTSRL